MDEIRFFLVVISVFGSMILGVISTLGKFKNKDGKLNANGRLLIISFIVLAGLSAYMQISSEHESSTEYRKQLDIAIQGLEKTNEGLAATLNVQNSTSELKRKIDMQNDSIDMLKSLLIKNQLKLDNRTSSLLITQSKLLDITTSTSSEITGDNSFCYFYPSIIRNPPFEGPPVHEVSFSLVLDGVYPLRNIKYEICDKLKILKLQTNTNCIFGEKDVYLGNKYRPANVSTFSEKINIQGDFDDLIFNVEIEASGKTFTQWIRMVKINSYEWAIGYKVSTNRFEPNENGGLNVFNDELKSKIDEGFPTRSDGSPDFGMKKVWEQNTKRRD